MKIALDQLVLDESRLPREQIEEFVRHQIVTGQMAAGTRLPSTEQLARTWNTHVATVHAALTDLVKDGLLVRVHGRGTFVRQREAKLTCVGIYKTAEGADRRSLFAESMQAALHEELTRAGIALEVWSDTRPSDDRPAPMPALERAIARRDIQALISLAGSSYNFPWLGKLTVPVSHLSGSELSSVNFDQRQFIELGLRALVAQGCRSVGLISPWLSTAVEFYKTFTGLVQDLGLTLKNPWILIPSADLVTPHEHYGYEQFDRLWRQTDRPDGLIVYPDSIARGVITGLLEKRVAVPGELKLVLHKNESIELLCPLPATLVISSERALARALVTQVQKQFRGEYCEPVSLPFRLVAHSGSRREQTNKSTQERG